MFLEKLDTDSEHVEFCVINDQGYNFEILFSKQGVKDGLFLLENTVSNERRNIKRVVSPPNLTLKFMQASFVTDNNQISVADPHD